MADNAEKEEKAENKPKRSRGLLLFLRDAGVALLFVTLVLLSMYAYTGLWPPLVVIESNSMMHGTDNHSHVGTIDTGDLVLVKNVDHVRGVETYVDGYVSGHRTYGDYGDVVIYKRGGSDSSTPIIHRAIMYLELNSGGTSYRCDSLYEFPSDRWSMQNPADTWDNLTSYLSIFHVGWSDQTITVDIRSLLLSQRSGFITKGDHNSNIDQMYGAGGPVDIAWIVGKARGEIPWFGLLKLWSTDTLGSAAPQNSVTDLYLAIAVIVVTPIFIDLGLTYRDKQRIKKSREEAGRTKKPSEEEPKKAEEWVPGKWPGPPKQGS